MSRSIWTIVLVLVSTVTARGAVFQDHLQCYKIKDSIPKAVYSADLTPTNPALAAPPTCKVKVPAKLLCVVTEKTNVTPLPPGSSAGGPLVSSYLCYKVKCPKVTPTLAFQDQFGLHSVLVKGSSLLCAPTPPPTTPPSTIFTTTTSSTTTTTSSTTTTTACGFEVCNGIDDDCDMMVDEGLGNITCGTGACQNTVPSCVGGSPNNCTPNLPSTEVCNNIDDDCDGSTDEGGANCPAPPNAFGTCIAGMCTIGGCDPGYADCNANNSDGCEVFTQGSDPNNCGGCGMVCNDSNPCTFNNCNSGACTFPILPNNSPCPGGLCQGGICTP